MVATTKLDRTQLAQVLRKQHQVISREQAIACGMTDMAIRHRIRPGGAWQALFRGVYLAQTGEPGIRQRGMAALLYAGPGSVITGRAALRQHGLRGPDPAVVDVLTPIARKRESAGFVRIHRTKRIPELFCVDGALRFVLAARAVADTARDLTELRAVRAVVSDSVQGQWCTVFELARELGEGPASGSALLRRVLAEITLGVRSVTEAEFKDLIESAGLPMPMFNARLFSGSSLIAVADAWWPAACVAAEVDSREWHLSAEDWERTLRRHARMTAHGILLLHFTPKQVRTEPTQVAAALKAALQAAQNNAQPSIRALPATA